MTGRPISCEEVMAQLFAYLDGEIGGPEKADIDRHIEWCRDCFTRAEFERRLKEKLAETGSAAAPERLRERVTALISRF